MSAKIVRNKLANSLKSIVMDAPIYLSDDSTMPINATVKNLISPYDDIYILAETLDKIAIGSSPEISSALAWIKKSDIFKIKEYDKDEDENL